MVHEGQGLPLGLEAGDHLPGVHARLDELEGHLATHGPLLLGQVHDAEASFAELLQEFVRLDHRAGRFGQDVVRRTQRKAGRRFQKAIRLVMGRQQTLDPLSLLGVAPAGGVEEG